MPSLPGCCTEEVQDVRLTGTPSFSMNCSTVLIVDDTGSGGNHRDFENQSRVAVMAVLCYDE